MDPNNIKQCKICKIYKSFNDFNKRSLSKDKLRYECKNCQSSQNRARYDIKKEIILKKNKEWYILNKEKESERKKKKYQLNKIKVLKKQKQYYQENKKERLEYHKKYIKNKRNINITFKLIINRRNRRSLCLKNNKINSTLECLGCTPQEWRDYLESKFDENMSWDNYGSYWHLDEVIPCSAWNQEDSTEQLACWHYLNTQPLEAKENVSKGGANRKDYTKEKQQFLMVLRALDIL